MKKIYESNRKGDAEQYLKLQTEAIQKDMGNQRKDNHNETEYP